MFVSISRAVLALFLVLVTSTITTASPVLQGRFHHYQHHRHPFAARKLESGSNSCQDDFETFVTNNPALETAYYTWWDEFVSKEVNCRPLDDCCNLDQDTWDSHAALSQACDDAGGTIYKTSFTLSCEFSLEGENMFEADIEVVNQHDCFPPTCTHEHIVASIEDYLNDEGEAVFEETQMNGTHTSTTTIDLDGGCNTTVTVADAEGMVIYQDGDFIETLGDGGGSKNDGEGSNGSTSTASNLASTSGMLMLSCFLAVVWLEIIIYLIFRLSLVSTN
jgi:hypothetical protein